MRSNWFYDDGLRSRFFEYLSSTGGLNSELEAIRASGGQTPSAGQDEQWQKFARSNPAAAQFLAEGEAWRSHFEVAAPVLRAVAGEYPGNADLGRRAAAMNRSLAPFVPQGTQTAVAIEDNLQRYDPRDRATLTRLGEIYADREMLDRARPYWNRMAE